MKTFKDFLESKINIVSESLRLIDTIKLDTKVAKIYKEDDEFIVKFFKDEKYVGEKADYHTDDKEDAVATANHVLKDLKD